MSGAWVPRSPIGDRARTPLRVAISAVFLFDSALVCKLAAGVHPSAISHPMAPWWVLNLGAWRYALAALVWILAIDFARRPAALGTGLAMLLAQGVLVESHGALIEGPMRIFFAGGAMLFGWCAGLSLARVLGPSARDRRMDEALAESGAAAMVPVMYVHAALSKLEYGGAKWFDPTGLRAVVLNHHPIGAHGGWHWYAHAITTQPWLALTLSVLTLVSQLSTLAYPFGPRGRAVAASLVLAFHVNTALVTELQFPQATALLIVFSYPWPRVFRARWSALPFEPVAYWRAQSEMHSSRWIAVVLALALAIPALAWVSPVGAYGRLTHRHNPNTEVEPPTAPTAPPVVPPSSDAPRPPPEPRAPWPADAYAHTAGLRTGDILGPCSVRALWADTRNAWWIECTHDAWTWRFELVPTGSRAQGPVLSLAGRDLYWGHLAPPAPRMSNDVINAAAQALAERWK